MYVYNNLHANGRLLWFACCECITKPLHVPSCFLVSFFFFLFLIFFFWLLADDPCTRQESTTRSVATPVHPRTEAERVEYERCWNRTLPLSGSTLCVSLFLFLCTSVSPSFRGWRRRYRIRRYRSRNIPESRLGRENAATSPPSNNIGFSGNLSYRSEAAAASTLRLHEL